MFQIKESAILMIHDKRDLPEGTLTNVNPDGVSAMTTSVFGGNASLPSRDDRIIKIKVQFNPKELTVAVTGAEQNPGEQPSPSFPKLVLTVPLVFDNVYNQIAFPVDQTQMLRTLVGGVAPKSRGVRTVVEGLLATLYSPDTRTLGFQWGEFAFHGTISYIDVKYTMFNPDGAPIRAEVSLRLEQGFEQSIVKAWKRQYDAIFGGGLNKLGL